MDLVFQGAGFRIAALVLDRNQPYHGLFSARE
jgi:hypothetical protein